MTITSHQTMKTLPHCSGGLVATSPCSSGRGKPSRVVPCSKLPCYSMLPSPCFRVPPGTPPFSSRGGLGCTAREKDSLSPRTAVHEVHQLMKKILTSWHTIELCMKTAGLKYNPAFVVKYEIKLSLMNLLTKQMKHVGPF